MIRLLSTVLLGLLLTFGIAVNVGCSKKKAADTVPPALTENMTPAQERAALQRMSPKERRAAEEAEEQQQNTGSAPAPAAQ